MRAALFRELYELSYKNDDLYVLADLEKNQEFGLIANDFSNRFINTHAAGQSIFSICAALLEKKKIVILCLEAQSFIVRWFEQALRVLPTISGTFIILKIPTIDESSNYYNIQPELTLMHMLPGLTLVAPGSSEELGSLLTQALTIKASFYFHCTNLHNTPSPENSAGIVRLFNPIEYIHGTQAICIGIGSGLSIAHQARLHLEEYGYSVTLASLPTIQPLNEPFLRKYLHSYSAFFVFESNASPFSTGAKIGLFVAENCERKIVFRSFNLPILNKKAFDTRAANLEILELMMKSNIIPNNQHWQGT